jgi:hypothetical protein
MKKELKIYRLHHKQNDNIDTLLKNIVNLQVGASLNNDNICDIKDNTDDNISHLNPIYSELTGHYWVWKNSKKTNYVGFEHYRRHFNLNEKEVLNCLKTNDIIVFKGVDIRVSVEEHYKLIHSEYDINLIKSIILELYPEYKDSYDKYITNGYKIIPCNSFISSWDVFDNMMTFIFNIFNKFNEKLSLNTYDDYYNHVLKHSKHINNNQHESYGAKWENYQLRIFGFLAERLMTLYVLHNFKNIKYVDYEAGLICPMLHTIRPKKAIILCMSCNKERYINEEHIIRKTWGKKIIDGKYDNIELLFYRGDSNENFVDSNNVLHLTSNDSYDNTFIKTKEALKWCLENKEFDYVIRTNTSTYVNIDAIEQFLNFEDIDDDVLYGPHMNVDCIHDKLTYLGGHFLIIPKNMVNIISKYSVKEGFADDVGIGAIIYTHFGQYKMMDHMLEVDNINSLKKPYLDSLYKSYCVRVKDEENLENNFVNMIGLHFLYKNIKTEIDKPHKFTKVFTSYGQIPI